MPIRKPQKAHVLVTRADVELMRKTKLRSNPEQVKLAAKCRASGREYYEACRSIEDALDALLSGIPDLAVRTYCERRLNRR